MAVGPDISGPTFLCMEKVNYQKELDNVIQSNAGVKRPGLLLHSCCGPCSSYCLDYLKDYFKITVFYYNPNIYPFEEYDHRLKEQTRLIDSMNSEYGSDISLLTVPYDHDEFLAFVKGLEEEPEGGARCARCFELRLKKTYDLAEKTGADYYATTLTVSPHKNAVVINSIGQNIAANPSVSWLPSDFKKKDGYKKSIELSAKYGLYRQNYCGCEFSMWMN